MFPIGIGTGGALGLEPPPPPIPPPRLFCKVTCRHNHKPLFASDATEFYKKIVIFRKTRPSCLLGFTFTLSIIFSGYEVDLKVCDIFVYVKAI